MKTVFTFAGLVVCALLVLETAQAQVAAQIIAREKASWEAWQKKDKTFWADFLTDDGTYFSPRSPYMETDPKVNFLPKIDVYFEQYKILDFQMYNARVQMLGDNAAVLTYNESVTADFGGKVTNFTGKVTAVYVKQGNTWKVAHGHETLNPGMD